MDMAQTSVLMMPVEPGPSNLLEEEPVRDQAFSYDEVFPALPEKEAAKEVSTVSLGQWNQKMKVRSSVVTQVFRVPVEERRFKDVDNQQFGEQGKQSDICAQIMHDTDTKIEVSSSKDKSLTILVTGKQENVLKARQSLVSKLQTRAQIIIKIPKAHHRFILGKSGKKLNDLQTQTSTQITLPRHDENSDEISITGPREGIDKARHEIQLISDEQAKKAFERLDIQKIYHPFIAGPHNTTLNALINQTQANIRIPPLSLGKDEIVISGDKESVAKAKEAIQKIYEEKKRKCQTVSVEVKKGQHRHVLGPRGQTLQELFEKTGVWVEVPPQDNPSETITLRGDQDKLGPALTMVYEKANSVVTEEICAKSWLHKYIIGKKGENIRKITQDFAKTHVEFIEEDDRITIEGPKEEVEQVRTGLEESAKEIMSRIAFCEIKVDPKFHRHIIGKNGANVNRLKQETNVVIHIPSDSENNSIVRIEGPHQGIEEAKQELLEMIRKLENEVTREVNMEQRFHKTIIGAKGDNIQEIRKKFNMVNVTFPEPGIKSDRVTIRGPKEDVEGCYRYLNQMNKDMILSNHKVEVILFKQFMKHIMGRGRSIIRRIQQETETRIELPPENSNSEMVCIIGKKENAAQAKDKLIDAQKELADIVEIDIFIPAQFHNSIIGSKGRLIQSIMEECGRVKITFPPEGSGSDKVSLRGPKEDVDKAKKQLVELTNEKQLSSYSEEVKAKPEHHRFLIGKNGMNIKKVRERTGARIIFPTEKDEDRESIEIIGKKEAVKEAKKELEEKIRDLEKVVEEIISVDPKFHRHFVARRGEQLRQISDDYGGVLISFPRSGESSDRVLVKGAKECVQGAKQRILEIVADLESMVTIECNIAQQYHRAVMGAKGHKVQRITQDFNVQIKFPDRENRGEYHENGGDDLTVNGVVEFIGDGPEVGDTGKPRKGDIIYITGKLELCEQAKEALMALVPVTEEIEVPFKLHRFIIGQKGRDVRAMMEKHDVSILVPPAVEESDVVKISGPPKNVESAKVALLERVEELLREEEDRKLRSFQLTMEVDAKYHPKIIGKQGAVVTKIKSDHKVYIQFPDRGNLNENTIAIIGYEKNCEAARDEIKKIVQEWEDMVSRFVEIDHRVHSRLIGAKGRNIRKIMEQFKVEIKFPRSDDSNPDQVEVIGPEEYVDEAAEKLKDYEADYLEDIQEQESKQLLHNFQNRPSEHDGSHQEPPRGFIVRGGPWEQKAPDTTSTQEFPSFGSADVPTKPVPWGPRR